jgi:hypothetical protein
MAANTDPFSLSNAVIDGREFNPGHPLISRVYPNANLERGEAHYSYRN